MIYSGTIYIRSIRSRTAAAQNKISEKLEAIYFATWPRAWKWELVEKSACTLRGYRVFDARNTLDSRFLLGCNPSMKGDLARCGRRERERDVENAQGERGEDGKEAARAESSEVHVSQYLSRPKLDFRNSSSQRERGFQTARFAAGLLAPCLPSRDYEDSSQYPVHYAAYTSALLPRVTRRTRFESKG